MERRGDSTMDSTRGDRGAEKLASVFSLLDQFFFFFSFFLASEFFSPSEKKEGRREKSCERID